MNEENCKECDALLEIRASDCASAYRAGILRSGAAAVHSEHYRYGHYRKGCGAYRTGENHSF